MALLAAGGFVVAGCSAPGPAEVTFYADGHTINVIPTIVCDYQARPQQPCGEVSTPPSLRVRPGKPVQISVPGEIAKTPWQIVFQYITPQGETRESDPIPFATFDQFAYTVTPPTPSDRIFNVEVQQYAAVLRTTNGAEAAWSGSWSVRLDA